MYPLASALRGTLLLLSLALVTACSDDRPPSVDRGSADAGVSDSRPADAPHGDAQAGCSRTGFTVATQTAERDNGLGVFFYTGRAAGSPTFDLISIDFYFTLGAKDKAQTVVSKGENLAACHTCLMLREGCTTSGCAKAKSFLWQSGTLVIAAMGDRGALFSGTLKDAKFAEVTIEGGTQETTRVPGGATWCLSDFSFGATVTEP